MHLGKKIAPLPSQALMKCRLRTLFSRGRKSDRRTIRARTGTGQRRVGRLFILILGRSCIYWLSATTAGDLLQVGCAERSTIAEPISQGTATKTLSGQGREGKPQKKKHASHDPIILPTSKQVNVDPPTRLINSPAPMVRYCRIRRREIETCSPLMARKKQDFFRVAPCARNDFPKALDTCEKW